MDFEKFFTKSFSSAQIMVFLAQACFRKARLTLLYPNESGNQPPSMEKGVKWQMNASVYGWASDVKFCFETVYVDVLADLFAKLAAWKLKLFEILLVLNVRRLVFVRTLRKTTGNRKVWNFVIAVCRLQRSFK